MTPRTILVRAQLYLVQRSLVLWTVVGLLSTFALRRVERPDGSSMETSFDLGGISAITPVLGVLAAALGARLFAGELQIPSAMYLRQLPLAPARLFWLKCAVGAGAMLATLALYAVWYHTGLAHRLQLLANPYALDPTPSLQSWGVASAWMLLVFVASAYFAAASERAGSARQAGVPGFLAATVLLAAPPGSLWGTLPAWLLPAAAGGVALVAAARLWPARAVATAGTDEAVHGPQRAAHRPLLLTAQLLLVVLPWCALVDLSSAWPYFGLPAWLGNALLWIAVGALLLPWVWLERQRLRLHGARAAALFAAGLTGVGYLLWRAVRPLDPRDRFVRLHATPAGLLALGIGLLLVVPLLLGGQRYARAWHLVAGDGVEILVDGEVVGRGEAKGVRFGGRLGASLGLGTWSNGTGVDVPPAESLRVGDLAATLRRDREADGRHHYYVDEAFAPDQTLALRRDGEVVPIEGVSVSMSEEAFRVHVHLVLKTE